MKAMILAAGLGTRLKPLTETIPKALVEINNVPLIRYTLLNLKYHGIKDVIINVHHFAAKIISYLEENRYFGMNICISDERDQLLDTGGGIKKASWFLNNREPFLVHNVDILTNLDPLAMMEKHKKEKNLVTLAVQNRRTKRFLLFNSAGYLRGWRNKDTGQEMICGKNNAHLTELAFSGIHIIDPVLFDLMPPESRFSIIKVYMDQCIDHPIGYYNHNNDYWNDVGTLKSLEQASIDIKTKPIMNQIFN